MKNKRVYKNTITSNFLPFARKSIFLGIASLYTCNSFAGTEQSYCSAQRVDWGNGCSGVTINHTGSEFQQFNVNNDASSYQGSAVVQCVNGQTGGSAWQIKSSTCSRSPPPPSPQSSNGAGFDGNSVQKSGADSTGIGVIQTTSAGAAPPVVNCNAQQVAWNANGYACQGYATADACKGTSGSEPTACPVSGNSSTLVEDAYGRGSAYYRCNGTNGQLELAPGSADCSATLYCPAQTYSWSESGATCSTDILANQVPVNAPTTIYNSRNAHSGSAVVECIGDQNGLYLEKQSGSCVQSGCGTYSYGGPGNEVYESQLRWGNVNGGNANEICESRVLTNYEPAPHGAIYAAGSENGTQGNAVFKCMPNNQWELDETQPNSCGSPPASTPCQLYF